MISRKSITKVKSKISVLHSGTRSGRQTKRQTSFCVYNHMFQISVHFDACRYVLVLVQQHPLKDRESYYII